MTGCICILCGESCSPTSPLTLRKVTGYSQNRGATGGVHGLRLRSWGDEYVHSLCVDRYQRGHRFGQQSLEAA